ncbi:MAG: UvrD-helicase domain-containing protein [Elusimicrobiota bacterium]|nr:MAG: UvrD-helicase domain-containing protein [Elusimicrobiota bacterium]
MDAPDKEDRDRARLSLEASVVVEAGAGTGKTTLLTDRILFLVLAGPKPAKVEEVVALTFTEKAAGEIKVRLSERLAELAARLSGGLLSEEARARAERTLGELETRFKTPPAAALERARAALEDLDKAPIGTIHSFCSQLLRLYPVEAGVDPAFRVDDGEGFSELFASEWAKWLDDELGERPPRRARWLELLKEVGLEELEALARELGAEKLPPEAVGAPDPAAARELRALADRAAALPAGKPKPKGGILDALAEAERRLRAAADAAEAEEPPLSAAEPPEPRTAKWPKAWEEDAAGAEEYERIMAVAAAASPRGEAVARRAARLLAPFAARLRREYARRGWVSFDGLLLRARDLVRDAARPREELKRRFAAILVDEFQDTDPLQGELLLYLSEAPGRAARSWTEVVPAPGRLFVVGDPKQSIYRFRGADIAAYEGFIGRLRAGGALACDLTANFRSVPGVVGPVNDVFSLAMKAEPGAQPGYKAIRPAKAALEGPGVQAAVITSPGGTADAAACQRTEAAWVAGRILSGKRPLKDYAVLLRSSSALPAFLDAFKRAGIPYAVEIERHFYGAPEVGDLLNLLRALDDPDDRAALAGLLRSPLAALSDDALLCLARAGALDYRKDPPPKALAESDRAAAARLFETLRSLRSRAGRSPLGELVAAALSESRLPELAARAYHGQQTTSNLLKLQRLAAEASESRGATLKDFVAEVRESARESRREGESPLADERLEAVRIMSVHKSKGLEFPVVFAANLSARPAPGTPASARLDWATGKAALRVGKAVSAAAALSASREKRLERRESVRLLYVAMTRAKESLFLLGREKPESGSLSSHLDLAGAWPAGGVPRGLPALFIEAGKAGEHEAPPAAGAPPPPTRRPRRRRGPRARRVWRGRAFPGRARRRPISTRRRRSRRRPTRRRAPGPARRRGSCATWFCRAGILRRTETFPRRAGTRGPCSSGARRGRAGRRRKRRPRRCWRASSPRRPRASSRAPRFSGARRPSPARTARPSCAAPPTSSTASTAAWSSPTSRARRPMKRAPPASARDTRPRGPRTSTR